MIGRAVVAGLHDGGYTVDWVRDGGEAELALANEVYDLALLDLGLPRRDGLEILKSLRRSGKELPVIFHGSSRENPVLSMPSTRARIEVAVSS